MTERDEHGNILIHNLQATACRGRPPDVPRIKTTASFFNHAQRCAAPSISCPPSLGKGVRGMGCPNAAIPPSPSALRAATSPEGRGKNAPMQVQVWHVLVPPLGELSPQVTERDVHGNILIHNLQEDERKRHLYSQGADVFIRPCAIHSLCYSCSGSVTPMTGVASLPLRETCGSWPFHLSMV